MKTATKAVTEKSAKTTTKAPKNSIQIVPAKKGKKAASKKATAKKQAAAVERNRIDPMLHIVKTVDTNPRRKDSHGYNSFKLIKNGMTVEQFVEKGGRMKDLHWDVSKGYLKLTSKAS